MNQKEFYKQLIHRYVTNQATEEELETFFALLRSSDMDEELQQYLQEEASKVDDNNILPIRKYQLSSIVAAAVVFIIFSAGGYFFLKKPQANQQLIVRKSATIQSGGNKAYLTLANGSKISLTDAKDGVLATQDKVVINKTADGKISYALSQSAVPNSEAQYNLLSTPRGGHYEAVLADGTHFILDAESSIRYPVNFVGNERKVEITGQVYFEVAHNIKMPFKVSVKGQSVEDLGTEFNINAFDDEPNIKTTLIKGSVSINQKTILTPGQQAEITNGSIKVYKANVEQVLAWKDGYFVFNNANIKDMMKELTRWYDFDISYQGDMSNIEFQGNYLRSRDLFKLLKAIELTNKVKFKVDGRRVIAIAK